MSENLIDIKNLNFNYQSSNGAAVNDSLILNHVNLSIKNNELVAICGPSGSGKSTLFYILGGLMRKYSGGVLFSGNELKELDEEQLASFRNKNIGFIFQSFYLLPKLTVLENILLPVTYAIANRSEYENRAKEYLKEFGLLDKANTFPGKLSGGQQQRVAIIRSLINDPDIILADEPTGNLDSKNSRHIMELLKSIHQKGKTILIITHDLDIASQCQKIIHVKDGRIDKVDISDQGRTATNRVSNFKFKIEKTPIRYGYSFKLALKNLGYQKMRTFINMLGIIIGIAAVFSMVTLGIYSKEKILESYATLGVNTIGFVGYPNWEMRATDESPRIFKSFDWDKDISTLKKIFPEIKYITPNLTTWDNSVGYGGKLLSQDISLIGVNESALLMFDKKFIWGKNFNFFHIKNRDRVCIIGSDIFKDLFSINTVPINSTIQVTTNKNTTSCKIIGVLKPVSSSKGEGSDPNKQIYLPYTLFQALANWWSRDIRSVVLQVHNKDQIESVGKNLLGFFKKKYGKSANFNVNQDSILIYQMNKFLNLFTILLSFISFMSLFVGGLGITNMMLVSIKERIKEIGVKKAYGASLKQIRTEILFETMIISVLAGLIGLLVGFISYEVMIYAGSKFIKDLSFVFIFKLEAFLLSFVSIFIVGFLTGLIPAYKAENLEVLDALKNE